VPERQPRATRALDLIVHLVLVFAIVSNLGHELPVVGLRRLC